MAQSLVEKLGIKPNNKVLILNAPKGYLPLLGTLPDGVRLDTTASGLYDFVQVFVRSRAELAQIAGTVFEALKPGGIIYFSYPKKSGAIQTDLSRDVGWEVVTGRGYQGVRLISVDDTWSAFRIRPQHEIKGHR